MIMLEVISTEVEFDRSASSYLGVPIFGDLLQYLSHNDVLPAIEVDVLGSKAVVTSRRKYLAAALLLQRQTIRATVREYSTDALANIIAHGVARELDWREIERAELAESVYDRWHVFFFVEALSNEAKRVFEITVVGLFASRAGVELGDIDIRHDDSRNLTEFHSPTFYRDIEFFREVRHALWIFNENTAAIRSYQGSPFRYP